jgi:aconitase A
MTTRKDGAVEEIPVRGYVDTRSEIDYSQRGGMLP